MRILIADDSRVARAILRRALHGLGYEEVEEAEDGRQALDLLAAAPFDLVIADWEMPRMGGAEMAAELRCAGDRDVPVLLAASEPHRDRIVETLRAGGQGYLRKPYDAAGLRAAIREAVRSRLTQRAENRATTLAGILEEVGLPELIQFLSACSLDGRLMIRSERTSGVIDLRQGEVRAASCGALFGNDAIFAISEIGSGTFRFEPTDGPIEHNVTMPVMPLLLEAMRQRDERAAAG